MKINSPLQHIKHIPHFYLIRMVELNLLSCYLQSAAGPILDLGCGDGEFCRALGLSTVYGIDIDASALDRVNRDGYYTEVQNAKASNIPYSDQFFKTIFSNCAVEHMDDLPTVLFEVRRVLVSGGTFIFTVPRLEFFDVVRNDRVLRSSGLASEDVITAYNHIHHHVNLLSIDDWGVQLSKAGFGIESYTAYLPDEFGRFVARMDMLYTIERPETKQLITKLEKRYNSLFGAFFRWRFLHYLKKVQAVNAGTHVIIKAKKL